MGRNGFWLVALFIFSSQLASGANSDLFDDNVVILNSQTQSVNSSCRGKSCHWNSFLIQVDNYKVLLPDQTTSFGTRMYAKYETKNVNQLEEYGIAQFLKGCQFTSSVDASGTVRKSQDIQIDIQGQIIDYRFAHFIIDGMVNDPIDWGDNPNSSSRHYFYQWNQNPNSFDPNTRQWYGLAKPSQPNLYVSDHPGTAFYSPASKTARNISVLFKTCLYKTKDVPKNVNPQDVNFAKPLSCFNWLSSFIYNFKTDKFDSPQSIDSFCKEN